MQKMVECGSYSFDSVIRGHHIYKFTWTPFIGEELILQPEGNNEHDKHAVAVMKDGIVMGHVPRSVSRVSWFFNLKVTS